jgi:hypothetical protein
MSSEKNEEEPRSSTDSLGPDYADSDKTNLRKSADKKDSVRSVQNQLPNRREVYVTGRLHSDLRVPSFAIRSCHLERSRDISADSLEHENE